MTIDADAPKWITLFYVSSASPGFCTVRYNPQAVDHVAVTDGGHGSAEAINP